jgi:thiol-disulfide isomerase/thioredoxin
MRRGVAIEIALLAAAGLAACAAPRPVARTSPRIGKPVELALGDISGRRVDVAAEEGKVRIIDFWATWCEPCRDELPFLDALQRQLGPSGLSIYAVSVDEDAAQIALFLREVPVSIPILWDKGGIRYTGLYDIQRLPTTFIVDRRGIVRFSHEEYDEAAARETRAQVEKLLAEPAR